MGLFCGGESGFLMNFCLADRADQALRRVAMGAARSRRRVVAGAGTTDHAASKLALPEAEPGSKKVMLELAKNWTA